MAHKRSGDSWFDGKMWRDAGLERETGDDEAWQHGEEEGDCGEPRRNMTTVEDQDGGRTRGGLA